MLGRRLILIGIVLLLLPWREALAQSSATSSQEQGLTNTQEIVTGNQTVVLQSTNAVRSFAIPGSNPLPPHLPVPSHFAQPVTDGNFGSLTSLLGYKNVYTAEEAEALVQEHGKMRMITTCFLPEETRKPKGRLQVLPDIKEKGEFNRRYEQIGVGNYKALDSNSISEQVLGVAIQEGLKIGADAMVFQEGASLIQVASGFSIGLFNSFSFVNNGTGNGTGNVSVGGIGYGKGKSAYASNPWLRIMYFRERPPPVAPARNNASAPKPADRVETPKPADEIPFTRLPFEEEAARPGTDVQRGWPGVHEEPVLQRPAPESGSPKTGEAVPPRPGAQKEGAGVHEEAVIENPAVESGAPKVEETAPPARPDENLPKDGSVPDERWIPSVPRGLLSVSHEKPVNASMALFHRISTHTGFYEVRDGETLASIAARKDVYGDPLKWPVLYRMNLETLGRLAVENLPQRRLPGGERLRIVSPPEREKNLQRRPHLWVVNVLSATREEHVFPTVARLAKSNYPVYVTTANVKGREWNRVRVGFFRDRAEAEAECKRIKNLLGIDNSWVDKANGMEHREFAGF